MLAILRLALFRSLLLATMLAFGSASAQTQPNKQLPLVDLKIGAHKLRAELANDGVTRQVGLMHRFSLKPDHGMLFVFTEPQPLAMWMKNTYIALSVAFIDDKGAIINIEDMKPQTLDSHAATGIALYALEMKQGWFAERGIKAGAKIEGLDKVGKGKN